MSGSGTSFGNGFGFAGPIYKNVMKAPPYLRGFGAEYPTYSGVLWFQINYNTYIDRFGAAIGTKIKADGKYGRQTNGAVKRLVNYAVSSNLAPGACTGDASCVDLNGPICVSGCLTNTGLLMTDSVVADMQKGFNWWQDLHAAHPADATAHDAEQEATTDGNTTGPAGGAEESGFNWGILAIIGLVAVGGYFMIQK